MTIFLFTAIVCGALLRAALMTIELEHIDTPILRIPIILGVGVVSDILGASLIAAPAACFLCLSPGAILRWRGARLAAYGIFAVGVSVVLFQSVADWLFWDEFTTRPNFIAVDYLVYTTEVVDNIRESYPMPTIFVALAGVSASLTFALRSKLSRALLRAGSGRSAPAWIVLPISLFWCALTVDPGRALGANARIERELAKNGTQSFVQAFRDNTLDYQAFYCLAEPAGARRRVRALLSLRGGDLVDDGVERRVDTQASRNDPNVVLICVESLSGEYVGALGNTKSLTPRLDELAASSVLFTQAYATGTRTVRGLEALTLSIPPTPGRSIVKRANCTNKSSIGFLFRERGYDTRFLYGGYAYFDNMLEFFSGNGFDVIDRWKLQSEEVTFANAWGVCDGDVLARTLTECDESFAADRPFFEFVMTTSNHRPYTYPTTPGVPAPDGRGNAVRYTDAAIGAFIDAARERPWFDDTIFVVVADHCAKSAGKLEIEVEKYHIPLLLYAPRMLEPARVPTRASQLDVAPTLLGMLGGMYTAKFFGRDLLGAAQEDPWVCIGNYQSLGFLRGNDLVVLQPNQAVHSYQLASSRWSPNDAPPAGLVIDAIAVYQTTTALLGCRGLDRSSWHELL